MTGSEATSSASANGSSEGASHTPTAARARNVSRLPSQRASGTMTGTPCGTSASDNAARTSTYASSTIACPLISRCIHALLEGVEADAVHGIHEALVVVPDVDVSLDEARDDIGHVAGGERGT